MWLYLYFSSLGSNCEINENDCASNPCKHGLCQDGINEYKCLCSPGYAGVFLLGTYSRTSKYWDQKVLKCIQTVVSFVTLIRLMCFSNRRQMWSEYQRVLFKPVYEWRNVPWQSEWVPLPVPAQHTRPAVPVWYWSLCLSSLCAWRVYWPATWVSITIAGDVYAWMWTSIHWNDIISRHFRVAWWCSG